MMRIKIGVKSLIWELFCWEIVVVYWTNVGRDTR
jgi:hypothetical protein